MNSISVRALLVRGMIAGVIAGALALAVAYFLGESQVDAAIAIEEAHSHAAHGGGGGGEEEELVSRTMQATGGLATALLVFGVAVGGIAALVYAYALGRIGNFGPRATAALIAGAALLTVYVVPFLKYPANPPAVGNPDTIGKRTTLFFLMVALSLLLAVAAVIIGKRLAPALGNWNATIAAAAGFVLAIGLAYAFLPSFDEVGKDFPASLLWKFRLSTLAVQTTFWAGFGLIFGYLTERLLVSGNGADARRVATPVG
ncbi:MULTISPECIES: CbtA family protein [Streptomyces]|uniref:CbtA family protein n=1 Tax=Streptomyces TaxID=1883 RepID=UPI0004C788C1|nr:CbtA family protein [Streptomyces cyaneofuscatus]WSI52325.1 CbtA family protein [Streptomyces cyaneofuscatus]